MNKYILLIIGFYYLHCDAQKIDITLSSNKSYCEYSKSTINFTVMFNAKRMLSIKKNITGSTQELDVTGEKVFIDIRLNNNLYQYGYTEGKDIITTRFFLCKKKSLNVTHTVDFKYLTKNFYDSLQLPITENKDYGEYYIKAVYINKKDTLYSNTIKVNYIENK